MTERYTEEELRALLARACVLLERVGQEVRLSSQVTETLDKEIHDFLATLAAEVLAGK